jgi:hypothetical protein
MGGIFNAVNKDIHLDSGKNVVPNGGLKFEEAGSHHRRKK